MTSSPSYTIYQNQFNVNSHSGGIAIGIHNSFTSTECSHILNLKNINFDFMIINARNEYLNIFVFNFYFNQKRVFIQALSNCLDVLGKISNSGQYSPKKIPTLSPLTIPDLQKLQQMMSYNKAISYDGISDNFLKTTKNYDLLMDLWKHSTLETNPLCYQTRLIPLNKAFSKTPTAEQFRPITLFIQILELRFLPKLQNYMVARLTKQQTGFVPNSSPQINITNILNLINSLSKKGKMNCIFIDFSNAFNCVNRTLLFSIIDEKQILDSQEVQFLQHLYSHLSYMDPLTKEPYYYQHGVPQGSPLSPALFNIYLEAQLDQVSTQCKIKQIYYNSFQFADDVATIISHKDSNEYLRILEQYSLSYSLNINRKKSGIFLLHNHSQISQILSYPIVQEYEYLGITIRNNGKLTKHVQNLKSTVNQIMKKLFWISREFSWKLKL